MSHEIESLAFAHETPWHGLGNQVDPSVSIEEMLVAAGLDWTVEPHEAFIEVDGKKVAIGRKAFVRSSDAKIMTVSGLGWTPVQNAEILEFFREYTAAGGATLETAGSLRGGKIVWGLAKIAADFKINGDRTQGYVMLSGSHEVGRATTARATGIRVVCANTMAQAERDIATYSQTHSRAFDVEAARATIELANQKMVALGNEAKALAALKMDTYDSVAFLSQFFAPVEDETEKQKVKRVKAYLSDEVKMPLRLGKAVEALTDAPGATPGTAWGVWNAITYWADHEAGRETDARLYRSWFGKNARLKRDAYKGLMDMTGKELATA